MSFLEGPQASRVRAAMQFWNGFHSSDPVCLNFDFTEEENEAVSLASAYLRSKNIKEIDFSNSDHRKYFDIAKLVNANITPSNPPDAEIALSLKQLKKHLDSAQSTTSKVEAAALFLDKCPNEITLQDIGTAYPDGVPHCEIPALLKRGVSEEVRLYLVYSRLHQIEQSFAENNVQLSLTEEFIKEYPEGVPLETALSILEKGANKPVEEILLKQLNLDLESQKCVAKEVEKQTFTAETASQFVSEFAKVIDLYHKCEEETERGKQEQKRISEAFDAICKSLEFRLTLQEFRAKNYTEIVDHILRQGVAKSIGEEAQQINQITREITEESDALSRRITECLEQKENLQNKSESFKRLNQDLKNYYYKKLKKLNTAVKIAGAIQLAASLSTTIAICLPHPAVAATAAASAALWGAVAGKIKSCQTKAQNRANNTLEKAEKTAHLLGYLSDNNLNELLALQGSRREEFAYLLANRHFIKPSVYNEKIAELETWLKKDKEDLAEEIRQNGLKKKKIDNQIIDLRKKAFFSDSSSRKKEIELQIIELEAELIYLERKNKECEENGSKDDKVLYALEEENQLADYVAPLTRIQETLLDGQSKLLPDKETQRFREAFTGVLAIQRAIAMEGFLTRSMIYDALAPIAAHLEFIAAENNWGTGVFKNAPHLLGLVRDAETLRQHFLSIQSFIDLCEKTQAKYKKELGDDYGKLLEKIGWTTVISQYYCPLLGMIGTAMGAGISLYRIHHPAKDKTVALLDEVVRCQTGLLRNLYQALSQQNQNILASLRANTDKILLRIQKGSEQVISHVDQSHFFTYEQSISAQQHKLMAKSKLLKFPSYLARARGEYFNGRQAMKGHENLAAVIESPNFYSSFLLSEAFQKGEDLPNMALFLSMVNRALELRKETTSLSEEEKEAACKFITESLEVIREFSHLLNGSFEVLTKALKSKVQLIEAIKKQRLDTSRTAPAKTRALQEVASWNGHVSLSGAEKFAISRMIHEKRFQLAGRMPFYQRRCSLYDLSKQTKQSLGPALPIAQTIYNLINPPRIFEMVGTYIPSIAFRSPIYSARRAFTTPTKKYLAGPQRKHLLEYSLMSVAEGDQVQVSLKTTGNSSITDREIQTIPFCSLNLQEYAAKVHSMVQTHLSTIRKGTPLTLPSKNKGRVPLTFPAELLESLANSLNSISFSLETLRVGKLTPTSYDLRFSSNPVRYEITIQYSIDFQEQGVENPLFCEFVVATFDFHTVHSFSTYESDTADQLITEHHENEFLLQAMYGGSFGLGLAGKGTYSASSSIAYAPVEKGFPGLYKLFEAFPNTLKVYDSKENESEDFGPMTKEQVKEKYKKDENVSAKPFEIRYNSDNYLRAWERISLSLEEFETKQVFKEYKHNYQLFFALCRLNSGMDKEALQNQMGTMLGLTPPDDLHRIVMETEHSSKAALQWERFSRSCDTNALQKNLTSLEQQLLDWKRELL